MKSRLAIMGAGGHGLVVADCALAAGWKEVVFFDDGVLGTPNLPVVSGSRRDLTARLAEFDGVVVGVGSNTIRTRLTGELASEGAPLVSLIHPGAVVSGDAEIGAGTVVLAGAVVSIGVRMGQGVIINTGATVDYGCVLGDGVHIAPGAHLAERVNVGQGSWIGIGANLCEHVSIGTHVVVGAGSVVVSPILDGLIVVGRPARPLRRSSR